MILRTRPDHPLWAITHRLANAPDRHISVRVGPHGDHAEWLRLTNRPERSGEYTDKVRVVATWRPEPTAGWTAFVAWTVCGALWTFSVLSFTGLFTLPLAAVLTWLLIRYTTDKRDAIGLVAGVAALVVYVGSAHIGETRCPESGTLTILPGGEGSVSCTDFVSTPWLVGGILLLGAALVLYRMVRRRHPGEPETRAANKLDP